MSSTTTHRATLTSLGATTLRLLGFHALRPVAALASARGHLFPLAPVAVGIGAGGYFALLFEPSGQALAGVWVTATFLLILALRGPELARPSFWALTLLCIGFAMAGMRTQSVSAPVLGWHRYGAIEGRIIQVDRSASDAVRLTLDHMVLPGLNPQETPFRVRVSLHGDALDVDPIAGMRVMLTGHLGPPPPPTEPGGFDFRRLAWFDQLGAVGYSRSPVLALDAPKAGLGLSLTRLRQRISAGIQARLPGETGGFVAAILTGDRSGVGLDTTEDLRRSNLSHLLAISGLHMGLLTGVVFGALRAAMALLPSMALRFPIRKIAAVGALLAAAAYLALSGGNIATQRAFVMAAAMLLAVIVERRAISLRSVGLAALILLLWRPEAILSAGFQMSFAATVALVAVFSALRDRQRGKPRTRAGPLRRLLRPIVTAALCSLVAGLATAPIAAAHFHRLTDYGLLANLVSVPLMGLLVMPSAVLAAVLWPIGGEAIGLWLMAAGTRWILGVANAFGNLEGAIRLVPSPPWWVVPVIGLGGLWVALWPGRARFAGVFLAGVAVVGWTLAERPALLIDRDGALVGLATPTGRALSRERGASFVASRWLELDGDPATQQDAAARAGFVPVQGGVTFRFADQDWVHLTGRGGEAALTQHCRRGVTVIINTRLGANPGSCRLFDARALSRIGAISVSQSGRITTAQEVSGQRPWSVP
ncbi:ComEC/Rec2 family competence protein [Pararhodobacter sp.]|uniref:ComEC/Rec2 family competence protein n=1 Tax=Pararhodobacter sp. TaxID=2127056 RepID=UPI002AFDD36A|nr:ComEC/Rec2 family competence protein [Pararhodobacter sp.]